MTRMKSLCSIHDVGLVTFGPKDGSARDPDTLPPPEEIAAEIVTNLDLALEKFRSAAAKPTSTG
jgi:type I restriction enzyme M protein